MSTIKDCCCCCVCVCVRPVGWKNYHANGLRINVTVTCSVLTTLCGNGKRGIFKNEPSEDQHSLFNAEMINIVFKNSLLIRRFGQLMKNTVVISEDTRS